MVGVVNPGSARVAVMIEGAIVWQRGYCHLVPLVRNHFGNAIDRCLIRTPTLENEPTRNWPNETTGTGDESDRCDSAANRRRRSLICSRRRGTLLGLPHLLCDVVEQAIGARRAATNWATAGLVVLRKPSVCALSVECVSTRENIIRAVAARNWKHLETIKTDRTFWNLILGGHHLVFGLCHSLNRVR